MARFAAFLRGMNLGGRRITNADLAAECEALGLDDVATFRASGNVIFSTSLRSEPRIRTMIEEGLREGLGYDVPTFIRSTDEVCAIAAFEPFDTELVAESKGKLQVTLLQDPPPPAAADAVIALATDADRLRIEARELYWLPSGGTLDSALDLKAIGELLGVGTTRTKGTMDQIAAKHFSS